MGKLPSSAIAATQADDVKAFVPGDGVYEPWPIGKYLMLLSAYELKSGPKADYWNLEFQLWDKYDQGSLSGRQFDRLSHSDNSAGAQLAFFNAFGYGTDSDIKELLNGGQDDDAYAWVYVGIEDKQDRDGNKKPDGNGGFEKRNFIRGYMPIGEDDEMPPLKGE